MLYINKELKSSEVMQEITRLEGNMERKSQNPIDKKIARDLFDQLNKSVIREALIKEQKGLCAYCMRRIRDNSSLSIEHIVPVSAVPSKALDYWNMVACCDGGKKADDSSLMNDINNVLGLNGQVDRIGNCIHDTSTRLVYGRRQVYKEFEVFIKGLVKKKKPLGPSIRKRIYEISCSDEYIEYAGVWLYYLNRKLNTAG